MKKTDLVKQEKIDGKKEKKLDKDSRNKRSDTKRRRSLDRPLPIEDRETKGIMKW